MIDMPDFNDRLDYALSMHGVNNAWLAAQFGPTGQQTVRGWRDRGRVGGPSLRRVRDLLPKTNIDWLQDNVGEPELLSRLAESSPTYDARQSPPARRDASILVQALKIVDADEALNGVFSWEKRAEILLDLCAKLEAGEDATILGMKLTHQRQKGETDNGAAARNGDTKRK
jgi:hypothetical protein